SLWSRIACQAAQSRLPDCDLAADRPNQRPRHGAVREQRCGDILAGPKEGRALVAKLVVDCRTMGMAAKHVAQLGRGDTALRRFTGDDIGPFLRAIGARMNIEPILSANS